MPNPVGVSRRHWRRQLLPGTSAAATAAAVLALLIASGEPQNVTLKIGLMSSLSTPFGSDFLAPFAAAVRAINNDPTFYLGNASMRVEPFWANGLSLTDEFQIEGQMDTMRLVSPVACLDSANGTGGLDVHAVVANGGTTVVTRYLPATQYFAKPVVAFVAQGDELSNKALWPTFTRVIPRDNTQMVALARVAQAFGWVRVGIFYLQDSFGRSLKDRFEAACAGVSIDIVDTVPLPTNINFSSPEGAVTIAATATEMREKFTRGNVKVYLLAIPLTGIAQALRVMNQSGQAGSGFTILTPTIITGLPLNPAHTSLLPLLRGSIGVQTFVNASSEAADALWDAYPETLVEWDELLNTSVSGPSTPRTPQPTSTQSALPPLAYFLWDATVFAARGVANAWETCGMSGASQRALDLSCTIDVLENTTYDGASGPVQLDDNGDRLGSFFVVNVVDDVETTQNVGQVEFSDGDSAQVSVDIRAIVWSDGTSNLTAAPAFGQDSPTADKGSSSDGVSAAVIVAAVIAGLAVVASMFMAWRWYSAERRKRQPTDFNEVIASLLRNAEAHGYTGPDFRALADSAEPPTGGGGGGDDDGLVVAPAAESARSDSNAGFSVPRELRRSDVVLDDVVGEGQFGKVYRGQWMATVGRVKSSVGVAVKQVESTSGEAELAFLEEAAVTWLFDDDNVVRMHGVVTAGAPKMIVLELCANGNLHSYISRDDADRSVPVLLDILRDVASGMKHLASKRFVHRDLAARNVLLDSVLNAKVCDFGLGRAFGADEYYRLHSETLLPLRWTDPWAIEHQVFTEKTDVWSFGVTAVETFSRGERPYGNWANIVVIEAVKEGYRLPRPPDMPAEVYEKVVLPSWVSADADGGQGEGPREGESTFDAGERHFAPRPTFAELTSIMSRLCASARRPSTVSRLAASVAGPPRHSGEDTRDESGAEATPSESGALAADAGTEPYVVTPLKHEPYVVTQLRPRKDQGQPPDSPRSTTASTPTQKTAGLRASKGSPRQSRGKGTEV